MGWFDDQIEYRKKYERELLSDSFEEIARSVTGRRISGTVRNDADVTDAVSQLLKHLGIKEREVPASVSGLQDRLEYLLAPTGVMSREVVLSKGWRHDAMGAMICSLRESGTVVAVLPSHMGGYEYKDPVSGKRVRVTARVERQISNEAICFYRPLPLRELTMRDLIRYMWSCLTVRDLVSFLIAAAVITLVGLLSPKLNYILTGTVVDMGSMQLLKAVVWFMLFLAIGNVLLSIIRSLLLERIRTKLSVDVGAATMMRLLSMPASYFKQYSAGELNQYVGYMDSLCTTIVDSVFSTAVTGLFSLVYLTQISSYAPQLGGAESYRDVPHPGGERGLGAGADAHQRREDALHRQGERPGVFAHHRHPEDSPLWCREPRVPQVVAPLHEERVAQLQPTRHH